ncbi:MAG: hypothetical protein HY748_00210 [Elusimicrobia bacterium]|nr:hypothetical protein [Elusimicrobiota bacterium]
MRFGRTLCAAGALATLIYVLPGHDNWLNVLDEGVMISGAARVLDGERPYRDFWTPYPPGQYHLLAALFRLFGPYTILRREPAQTPPR